MQLCAFRANWPLVSLTLLCFASNIFASYFYFASLIIQNFLFASFHFTFCFQIFSLASYFVFWSKTKGKKDRFIYIFSFRFSSSYETWNKTKTNIYPYHTYLYKALTAYYGYIFLVKGIVAWDFWSLVFSIKLPLLVLLEMS